MKTDMNKRGRFDWVGFFVAIIIIMIVGMVILVALQSLEVEEEKRALCGSRLGELYGYEGKLHCLIGDDSYRIVKTKSGFRLVK